MQPHKGNQVTTILRQALNTQSQWQPLPLPKILPKNNTIQPFSVFLIHQQAPFLKKKKTLCFPTAAGLVRGVSAVHLDFLDVCLLLADLHFADLELARLTSGSFEWRQRWRKRGVFFFGWIFGAGIKNLQMFQRLLGWSKKKIPCCFPHLPSFSDPGSTFSAAWVWQMARITWQYFLARSTCPLLR